MRNFETTPYGGHLRWTYAAYTLSGSRTFREVQNRYLLMCPSNSTPYCSAAGPAAESLIYIYRDPGDTNRTVHVLAQLVDNPANAAKIWSFQTGATFDQGLQINYEERSTLDCHNPLLHQDFTWAQTLTSLNPYIGTTLTTMDWAQTYQVQKKTNQTLDQYGNVTEIDAFDFGNLSVAARIYTNTYLSDANYVSRYIRNRLVDSSVVGGSQSVNLIHNVYDGGPPANVTGLHEHDDANYGTSLIYRGNVVSTTTPAGTKGYSYDIGGNVVGTTVNGVYSTVVSNASTNWAAPYQVTTGSLTSTMNWNAARNSIELYSLSDWYKIPVRSLSER